MQTTTTDDDATDAQPPEQPRACDRCGRDRPANAERFAVSVSDFTPSTADYEQALLCRECWRGVRDDLRGWLA